MYESDAMAVETALHHLPFLLASFVLVGFYRRLLAGSWRQFCHGGLFTPLQKPKMAIGQTRPCMVKHERGLWSDAGTLSRTSKSAREEAFHKSHASRVVVLKVIWHLPFVLVACPECDAAVFVGSKAGCAATLDR